MATGLPSETGPGIVERSGRKSSSGGSSSEPQPLGDVLSQLFAARGYGRVRGDRHLHDAWADVAGEQIRQQTKVIALRNGVLQVAVSNSALLSELVAFHKADLVDRFRSDHPECKVRDLKFRLRGDMK